MPILPPPPPPHSTVGVFGYLCLCLNVFFFSALLAADPWIFKALTREDYWVENLTAVWFLLAGLLLFVTARAERSFLRRCVYILGGMAMVFAAGEEISWGQRIFGFATPDFLMPLNAQKEFNVHNISYGTFDSIYRNGALILCMVTSAAFFCRKDRLWGIPLPSILLMLGFLLLLSYDSRFDLREFVGFGVFKFLGFIVFKEKGLLLLLLIFALLSGQVKWVVAPAATLALVLALSYVNYHNVYFHGRAHLGSLWEVREYLFGMGCLFYCLELLPPQGRLAAISRTSFSGLKLPGGRIPFWMMTCRLVIAGSIGLMFFGHFSAMSRPAAFKEAYRSITASEPAVRSYFDVYLSENELIYVKEPCARADTEPVFFLHLYPVDANDLPEHRRQYSFDNLDFGFESRGTIFDKRCMARVPLPEYDIARIGAGQYVHVEGGYNNLWEVEFRLDDGVALIVNAKESREAALRSYYETLVSGEPVMRSDFDVYLSENTLTYVKEPCASADTEALFFLHLRPVDVNDLPDDRKKNGFENRDFDFGWRGMRLGGRCMARIPLPEYAIARISTGQFVTVEGGYNHLWEAEIHLER